MSRLSDVRAVFAPQPGDGVDAGFVSGRADTAVETALADADRAGLLDGGETRHLSFRVPKALYEAAQRETGLNSPTELGTAALAMLAQRDSFADFMRTNRGALGPDHDLEY